MAGGEGTRLRPLTSNRPKPLVPVCNKPIAQHIVEHLVRAGVPDIAVTLYYLGEAIQSYLGDGSDFGANLYYTVEDTPLGTAGAVKLAEEFLGGEPFIIVSGDALTDIDIAKALAFHREKGAEATIILQRVANPLEFGVVMTEDGGKIQRFLEKPSWGEVFSDTVNTGMYIIEPSVLAMMEPNKNYDWSQDIFPKMLSEGRALYGYTMEEYWCDVGSLEQYRQAQYEMLAGMTTLPVAGEQREGNIWIGEGTEIDPKAILRGPLQIGANCRIKAGAVIGPDAVVGDNAIIETGAVIEKAVLWDSVYVGSSARISGCTVCYSCTIQDEVEIEEGAVIGDRCHIEAGATIRTMVKLWPDKFIEADSQVTSSLIWGNKHRATLFRGLGVTGLTNVELTPEFATKLGASFGAYLKKGATVVTARDSHPASRMLKRALLSGLCSVGCNALDVQAMPVPLARSAIRGNNAQAGINVRIDPNHPRSALIEFFDHNGIYLTKNAERKIETIFFREDYGRTDMEEIGEIKLAPLVLEQYKQHFNALVERKDLARRRFKVVVDYAYGPTASILPELLGQLGCEVIALNAYLDWSRAPKSPQERQTMVQTLSQVVLTLGADLGVLLHSDGERVELVTEKGEALYGSRLLATVASLVAQTHPETRVAVPITAPSLLESAVAPFGGTITRTKTEPRFLMTLATLPAEKITMAGDLEGGILFSAFYPGFDGMFAFVKILQMLSWLQKPLSEIVAALPQSYLAARTVRCPWDQKGSVMRMLTEESQGHAGLELIDGIKVTDAPNQWVLVLPDSADPTFHVHTEDITLAAAERRADEYIAKIEHMLG
jgi:mannose-1-phosphate guanylyltransferase / phosphomannomutase